MAQAKLIKLMLIRLGDGAVDPGPEVFKSACALATKGIAFSANVREDTVFECPSTTPDNDEPGKAWIRRTATALSANTSGSGKMAAEDFDLWWNWFSSGEAKNIQNYLRSEDDTTIKGHFAQSAVLSGFELGQEEEGLIDVSVTVQSDGEVTWVPAV